MAMHNRFPARRSFEAQSRHCATAITGSEGSWVRRTGRGIDIEKQMEAKARTHNQPEEDRPELGQRPVKTGSGCGEPGTWWHIRTGCRTTTPGRRMEGQD
ncbi:hypothetical protein I7I51_04980 [Histoplasma capsulatum]|uniref:Uncharacterized protein n=1 Tax=Ajellomyces capsulatus TaxID=5037 RepID=A0A8A1M607_AJECA|nr:hypothetical protein I7I51_04980 [Histoplasma capsulatum]